MCVYEKKEILVENKTKINPKIGLFIITPSPLKVTSMFEIKFLKKIIHKKGESGTMLIPFH